MISIIAMEMMIVVMLNLLTMVAFVMDVETPTMTRNDDDDGRGIRRTTTTNDDDE